MLLTSSSISVQLLQPESAGSLNKTPGITNLMGMPGMVTDMVAGKLPRLIFKLLAPLIQIGGSSASHSIQLQRAAGAVSASLPTILGPL